MQEPWHSEVAKGTPKAAAGTQFKGCVTQPTRVFLPAGASQHSLAEQTSAEVVAQMFALNTLGPINLTRAALPHMLTRRRGRIVVVSSMAGLVPSPGQAIYSACKHALNGYFATLLTEVCDRCAASNANDIP